MYFLRWDADAGLLFFFDPLLIKELTITFIQTPGAVIMVITKTMKGKAAANSICFFFVLK